MCLYFFHLFFYVFCFFSWFDGAIVLIVTTRLFFMMAKQQPFSELEVGTAVNSCIKQSIQLDQYEDFQASHDLKPGLGRCFVEGGGVRWISPMLP